VIDIGTTTARLAHSCAVAGSPSSPRVLAVVDELRDEDSIELIVLGGVLRNNYLSLVGMLTEQALGQLRANVCFLSASGIRAGGQVRTPRASRSRSRGPWWPPRNARFCLPTAASSRERDWLSVCGPDQIATLVTNRGARPEDPGRLPGSSDGGHHRMKLAILGGGGFRVPQVFEAIAADDAVVRIDELVLTTPTPHDAACSRGGGRSSNRALPTRHG